MIPVLDTSYYSGVGVVIYFKYLSLGKLVAKILRKRSRWTQRKMRSKVESKWKTADRLLNSLHNLDYLGRCLLIQRYFCAVYNYARKADLSKGYWNQKRKLG